MTSIYVICPIDRDDDRGISLAYHREVTYFTPSAAFDVVGPSDFDFIVRVNAAAIDHANAVLAFYKPGIETWGMPMELFRLAQQSPVHQPIKPVALIVPNTGRHPFESWPIHLRWAIDHLQANTFDNVDLAVDWLLLQVATCNKLSNEAIK